MNISLQADIVKLKEHFKSEIKKKDNIISKIEADLVNRSEEISKGFDTAAKIQLKEKDDMISELQREFARQNEANCIQFDKNNSQILRNESELQKAKDNVIEYNK